MTSTSRRTFCLQSLAAGLSAVTLLSGCAVTPQNARVWRGRFSLRITAADGRLENQTGRFEPTKTPQFLRLDLHTPLSGILARIEETSRGASFTRSLSEPAVIRSDIDALLTELLGFTLPVVPLANLLEQTAAAETSVYGPWRAQILSRFTDGSPQRLKIDGRAGQTAAAPLVQLTIFVEA